MRRFLVAFVMVVGIGFAVTPAGAHDFDRSGPTTSVFPQPRDPWRSWGVRQEVPHRLSPAPDHRWAGRDVIVATPTPAPVWVPGQWWWDGFNWQWASGYWTY